MKYIILLLIGLTIVTTSGLDKRDNTNQANKKTESSVVETPSKPEEPKAVKTTPEAKETRKWEELSLEEKVKANPNNCDLSTQVMHEDGSCHAKPVASTPPASSKSGDCSLVYKYSNWDQNVAYAVCMAESSGDPNNENLADIHRNADGSVRCIGSFGLMQLACFWIANPKDPIANMAKANEIYSRSGWKPWGAYTSGKYLKYLR